jgi:hypothetical protein
MYAVNRKYKLLSRLRKSFGLSMLILYCCGAIQYTIRIEHKHSHPTDQCEHNSIAESDPCHRSLVHHDFENGCKHSTHFENPLKHCSLCDMVLHFDHINHGLYYNQIDVELITEEIAFDACFISGTYFYTQGRGPPTIS